jgi:hypothetical protein
MELTMKSDIQIMRNFTLKLAALSAMDSEEPQMDEKGPNAAMSRANLVKGAPGKKPGMLEGLRNSLPSMPDLSNIDYGSTAGGLGGGLAGGLGAMSLANMFRSEKDKEEGNTPWWSALAGAGGAVGGGVLGAQYLPQLLAALTAQKSTPSAATAAPAAAKA